MTDRLPRTIDYPDGVRSVDLIEESGPLVSLRHEVDLDDPPTQKEVTPMTEQSEKEPAPDRQVFTFAQMIPTGVLWLINRTVFHPRGLALGLTVATDDDGAHAEGWEIIASPDGTPYKYDDPEHEALRHREVEQLFDLVRAYGVMPPPLTSSETEGATPTNHDDAPWGPCCSRTDPHEHDGDVDGPR